MRNASLTDDHAEMLGAIGTLTTLKLAGNRISPDALARLKQALPDCNVIASDEGPSS
ncbi:hypothetical protein D3C83_282900 [compost metagenome]